MIKDIIRLIHSIISFSTEKIIFAEETKEDIYQRWGQETPEGVNDPPENTEDEPKAGPPVDEEKGTEDINEQKNEQKDEPKAGPPATIEEIIYQISDKVEISERKLSEIAQRRRAEIGEDIFDRLPEEARYKLIEDGINIYEGSRKINERHQENAADRKEIADIRDKITKEQEKITKDKQQIEKQLADLKKEQEKLEKIKEKDIEDIVDIDERLEAKLDQREANKRLNEISTEEQQLQAEIERKRLETNATVIRLYINELQSEYQELNTGTEDPIGIYEKFNKDIETLQGDAKRERISNMTDNEKRSIRLSEILQRYINSTNNNYTIADFYAIKKSAGEFTELNLTAPAVKNKKISVKDIAKADLLKKILTSAKSDTPTPDGKTSEGLSTKSFPKAKESPDEYAKKTKWKYAQTNIDSI
jgi:DNA repair exonuclease SbcCD ATPase subunit